MHESRRASFEVPVLAGTREHVPWIGRLRRRLFAISSEETLPSRRGFAVEDAATEARLARVGATFLAGYHAAMAETAAEPLARRLDATVALGWRGFAFEGAAFGLAILDTLTPWSRSRFDRFVFGPAAHHVYLAYVGLGWTFARLPRRIPPIVAAIDPHYRWLTLDGYGFHQGFFAWPAAVTRQEVPRRLSGYARRGFDQGLGRSLWFVRGGRPGAIAAAIGGFAPERQADLWSGIGLAATYAGGVPEADLVQLGGLAGSHRPHLAQGAAFAAEARVLAADLTPELELACRTIWGRSPEQLAEMTRELGRDLPADESARPAFEAWRERIRCEFYRSVEGSPP
jgi:enediyne biosynthesis protein E3